MGSVSKIELPAAGLDLLLAEARAEGHTFVGALAEQWASAENRFNGPGEGLFGYFDQGSLVGVGAIGLDPYAGAEDTGRIRRVYVRPAWRNRGIGRSLLTALITYARKHFRRVRLRAENEGAARLYENLGFLPIDSPDATHLLGLDTGGQDL